MGGLDDLYQELILDHYRRKRGEGSLEHPSVAVDQHNPLCGDEVHLELGIVDGRVAEVAHTGEGCSISQASVSMMTQALTGQTLEGALDTVEHFRLVMHGDETGRRGPAGRRDRPRGRRQVPGAGEVRPAGMDGRKGRDSDVPTRRRRGAVAWPPKTRSAAR